MQSPVFSKSHFLLKSSQLSFRYQNVLLNRFIDVAVLWQLLQKWQSTGSVLKRSRKGELQWAWEGLLHEQRGVWSVFKNTLKLLGLSRGAFSAPSCPRVTVHTFMCFHRCEFPFCSVPFLDPHPGSCVYSV